MAKKPAPFHNPFLGLKLKKEEQQKPAASKQPAPPPRAPAKPSAKSTPEEDELALFRQSIGSVEPVKKGPGLVTGGPPPADAARIRSEDEDVVEELALLVGGTGEFELADSTEFIEGAARGLDRRIVQKLKRGEYPVQGRLDLHGMGRVEAQKAVETFVTSSRRAGKRCVLIVHGRGLNSEDNIPVLKQGVQAWLSRGRVGREVMAFTSARPQDGGAGAVYVLLRR